MVNFEHELDCLVARIGAAGHTRHRFHPALTDLIMKMRASGHPVAKHYVSLEKSLLEEAVEAQFENLPV